MKKLKPLTGYCSMCKQLLVVSKLREFKMCDCKQSFVDFCDGNIYRVGGAFVRTE